MKGSAQAVLLFDSHLRQIAQECLSPWEPGKHSVTVLGIDRAQDPQLRSQVGMKRDSPFVLILGDGVTNQHERLIAFDVHTRLSPKYEMLVYTTRRPGQETLTTIWASGSTKLSLSDVGDFALDNNTGRFAFTRHGRLFLADYASGSVAEKYDAGPGEISDLTWSPQGSSVSLLYTRPNGSSSLVVLQNVGSPNQRILTADLDALQISSSQSYIVNAFARLNARSASSLFKWRSNDEGLYVRVRSRVSPRRQVEGEHAGPVIWRTYEDRLPTQKFSTNGGERLYLWTFRGNKVRALGEPDWDNVEPSCRGDFVLAYDTSKYGWKNPEPTTRARQLRDYYLVNLLDGTTQPLLRAFPYTSYVNKSVAPQISPDGKNVFYQDSHGDYCVFSLPLLTWRNLTKLSPIKTHHTGTDELDLPLTRFSDSLLVGWERACKYVVVSDSFDLWVLYLDGGAPVNLTGDKVAPERVYSVAKNEPAIILGEGSERYIDMREPIFLHFVDQETRWEGLAQTRVASPGAIDIHTEFGKLDYIRAGKSDRFAVCVRTSTEPADYFLLENGKRSLRLSDSNPEERMASRWTAALYLRCPTPNGEMLSASLHLPEHYIAGKRYPTIVQIYEEGLAQPHNYPPPGDRWIGRWLKLGYAVLLPDIRPRVNAPGIAALEAVNSAIDVAVNTGVVDKSRLGLTGHSHGAYETYYIIARSNLFRAAVADAGVTDLLSSYGSLISGSEPQTKLMITGQPYMKGPWWTEWNAYIQNSPLYNALSIRTPLLMIHGERDDVVLFSQALEMFNTLRWMGDRPAILLQYPGEGHNFTASAKRDAESKVEEFFSHYLKDGPPPTWFH
ncbi:MAG: acylaminoacyl-peptidase [Verrucomicrobia bacterium]|nr:acylaminoacyl-peptidase [Verrucomicrobiota bacterium]